MSRASHYHNQVERLSNSIVTLSEKRQFTLPLAPRRQYGLLPGDPVAVSNTDHAITLTPIHIAAVRFDHAYRRFSIRCTTLDRLHKLGVEGNLSPGRVTRLTGTARWVVQARQHPDAWIAIDEREAT